MDEVVMKSAAQHVNGTRETHAEVSTGASPGRTPAPAGITPEIMAVIEEAASAFVGRDVRIVSVKLSSEARVESSSWADQGRAAQQTSHNLVQRGH